MTTVLIIDDEENLRKLLSRVVELEGYHVLQAASVKDGLKALQRSTVHVVISDVRLPDGNGVELTAKIKKEYPATEVIVLTAFGTIESGVQAIKNGAFDYLTKGDHQERIIPLLSKASEKAVLQYKVVTLELTLHERFGFDSIIGKTPAILDCIDQARKVSVTTANILLLGETGTGKEVFAQAIHYESPRRTKPFVALNCSAFPKDLLESEIFGYAEGAFTGAARNKKGYVEEAHEGTLFLDEIGEMNIDLQAKLLRVIESGEFHRLGDNKPRRVDVRFIAATNRNLERESEAGGFRNDLFYRLSVFTISLPPLRERKPDIALLAAYFADQFAHKTNKAVPLLTKSFLDSLQLHPWKGNIRELKNILERAVILADGELDASSLPVDFSQTSDSNAIDLATIEKNHILKILRIANGNKTQAAKLLNIGISTLYTKLKEYEL